MDPNKRERILRAVRDLGAEPFNRLVESVDRSRQHGRLRFWQEELLETLPGVGSVSFMEFLDAFGDAVLIPVPSKRSKKQQDETDAKSLGRVMLVHPRLGPLTLVEEEDEEYHEGEIRIWEAAVDLPSFVARGTSRRSEDDPPGRLWVRIEMESGKISPEQEAAIAHLLDHEPQVFAAVWAELAPEFPGFDLETELLCTEVIVSYQQSDGVAYLGFSIDTSDHTAHLEHGFQVVYHPTRGTFWGDWEALNMIEE
jgi:hypothetical protein